MLERDDMQNKRDNEATFKYTSLSVDYKGNVLSPKEAERIFNAGFPKFSKMIAGAKIRFYFPESAWEPFDSLIRRKSM